MTKQNLPENQDNLFELACARCGVIDEPRLEVSGKHIKAVCAHCNEYIKFVPQATLPTVEAIRLVIWNLAQTDLRLINSCKILCGFKYSRDPLESYTENWKLYLKVKYTVLNAAASQ